MLRASSVAVASIVARLRGSSLLGSTMLLVSGTAAAQIVTAGAMPLLSRLYAPAEVGLLAVFTGLLTTTAVAACLRFDIAVALPPAEEDAAGLLVLSTLAAAVVSLLIAMPVMLAPGRVAAMLGQPGLVAHLWLLPIGIFGAAVYSALQTWNLRAAGYRRVVQARMGQAVVAALVQITCGLAAMGVVGLIAGYVAGFLCGGLILAWSLIRRPPAAGWIGGRRRLTELASRFRRFPLLSTWEALANNGAIQLPIVIIGALAAPAEAGYLMWAIYAAQAPMALVGNAMGQVFLSRAPRAHAEGQLPEFTLGVISRLLTLGLGPLLALGILAPAAFEFIFGPGWARSGWLVAWMIPWFLLQFVSSPVSMTLHVLEFGRAAMLFQLAALVIRVGAVVGAASFFPEVLSQTYALSGALVYGILLVLIIRVLSIPAIRVWGTLARAMPVTIAWVAGALTLLVASSVFRLP